jgi:alkanesulfonate monooxygenase SsuD/methylene tetrahydromethanopterin reductase-like flavin-dependent oxidoreductase (luciferase family)
VTFPVWLTIPQFANSFDLTSELARRASSLELAGLFTFDHLVPLEAPHRPVLEGSAVLGALAAVSTVPVGSLVTRVTLRAPSITAGIATTLSDVSHRGAVLGLGVGDRLSEDEARRFGMELQGLDQRIALLESTITLVREFNSNLAIWVAGKHPKVRSVTVRMADGWTAWEMPHKDFAIMAAEVRSQAKRQMIVSWGGRILMGADDEAVEREMFRRNRAGIIAGTADVILRELTPFVRVADHLVVSVLPNQPQNWELFATKVLARLG